MPLQWALPASTQISEMGKREIVPFIVSVSIVVSISHKVACIFNSGGSDSFQKIWLGTIARGTLGFLISSWYGSVLSYVILSIVKKRSPPGENKLRFIELLFPNLRSFFDTVWYSNGPFSVHPTGNICIASSTFYTRISCPSQSIPLLVMWG